MNKKNINKLIFGVAVIGALGCFSINQANADPCWDYEDRRACTANNCHWDDGATAECVGNNADCWYKAPNPEVKLTKNECRERKGCSWYVGCRSR